MNFGFFKFHDPLFLWLLLLLPLLIYYYRKKLRKSIPTQELPSISVFNNKKKSFRESFRSILPLLRILVIFLLIIALARPQTTLGKRKINAEGIDIVISLDISGSMLARDFIPDRLSAAKKIASEFIFQRENDRIGLVVFSSESFTQCPVTIDHSVLIALLSDIQSGIIEDGTAIGNGLATAVDRLKKSKSKEKVIILLTDGINNTGFIEPITAAEIAKSFKIRVYTIGIGTMGYAPYPVQSGFGLVYQNEKVKIDETLLKQIAQMTGGAYFRATSNDKLRKIYNEIDKLEKTRFETTHYIRYNELFLPVVLMALIFFLIEMTLRFTYFRTFP